MVFSDCANTIVNIIYMISQSITVSLFSQHNTSEYFIHSKLFQNCKVYEQVISWISCNTEILETFHVSMKKMKAVNSPDYEFWHIISHFFAKGAL